MTPAQQAALRHMSKFKVIGRLYTEPADVLLRAPHGLYWLSPRGDLTRVETEPR